MQTKKPTTDKQARPGPAVPPFIIADFDNGPSAAATWVGVVLIAVAMLVGAYWDAIAKMEDACSVQGKVLNHRTHLCEPMPQAPLAGPQPAFPPHPPLIKEYRHAASSPSR